MINTVVAEADEIIYKAAASIQKVGHIVHFSDGRVNDLADEYDMTNLKKFYKEQGLEKDVDFTVEIYPIYHSLDQMILKLQSMITRLYNLARHEKAAKYGIQTIENVELWLSFSDRSKNFRFDVVKTPGKHGLGYKAGRGEKPKYINEAKEFVIEIYGAKETDHGEADDKIAMRQTKNSVLASIDKDLLMIPGCHYNWYYDQLFHVPEGLGGAMQLGKKTKPYGLLCFYTQLLCGDDIDNIPGCLNPLKAHHKNPPRFTMESALKYLQDQDEDSEQAYWDAVALVYQDNYGEDWVSVVQEVADLVFICRSRHETGRQYLKSRGYL